MVAIRLAKLTSDAEWGAVRALIDPKQQNAAVKNILDQLRGNNAASVIVEEEYLDQDFTAVYSAFYATVFKRHTKLCRRMHFFKEDVTTGIIDDANALASSKRLGEIGERSYLGFIVIRPVPHAPLGRVVIAAPPSTAGAVAEVLVRAQYEVHLLGATLKVLGIAMTQQDSRVGSCAQATIWMAGRHFHMRHRGPWFSTVAITDAATQLTDFYISRSLPAGSEFLTQDNMLRALRAMDREPLFYMGDIAPAVAPATNPTVKWNHVRPHDVILRYADSGIPVILGLLPVAGQSVGHAVLVTGETFKELPAGAALPTDPTHAEFCENFLVHDDQRGSNVPVAIRTGRGSAAFPYTIEEHLAYLIAPLPAKVFIAAEAAEKIAWDTLRRYQADWAAHKAAVGAALGTSVAAGDGLVQELAAGRVVARTYLTYGWRYKARMLRNAIGENFKSVLFYHDLPRLVWVTEFGTFASLNHVDVRRRRIFAHNVIDATGSPHWESRSIFHAPGMSVRRFHDETNQFGDFKEAVAPVADDVAYFPKVRGEQDYSQFPARP